MIDYLEQHGSGKLVKDVFFCNTMFLLLSHQLSNTALQSKDNNEIDYDRLKSTLLYSLNDFQLNDKMYAII